MSKNYFSNQSHDKEKNKVMGAQHKDKFKNSSDNLIWDKVYKLKREDWRKTKITKMPYRRQGRESYSTKKKNVSSIVAKPKYEVRVTTERTMRCGKDSSLQDLQRIINLVRSHETL